MVLEKLLLAGWDIDRRALPSTNRCAPEVDSTKPPPSGTALPTATSCSSTCKEAAHASQPPALVAGARRPLPPGWATDPAVLEPQGATALLLAAAAGERHACVSWLLASGARRDAVDGRGATALMVAAAAGQWDSFGVLLPLNDEGKVDPDCPELWAKDATGRTLLHVASYGGCCRVLQLLVDSGLDPASAAPSSDGRMCMHHLAAGSGSRAAAELLLAAGCSADKADAAGSLPWHLAAEQASVPCFPACLLHVSSGFCSSSCEHFPVLACPRYIMQYSCMLHCRIVHPPCSMVSPLAPSLNILPLHASTFSGSC